MDKILSVILKTIKKQPNLELETELTEEDKAKISTWASRLGVELYFEGVKDGKKQ